MYGVLGPNGAGKTTFLRMLFGLIRPDAGTIRVFGRTWAEDGTRILDGVAGFIESPRFYPYLTGRQNLEGLALLDGGVATGPLEEVLDIVDLADRADDKVGGYSYGMRQRLGVAASLLREPAAAGPRRAGQRPGPGRHPRHARAGQAARRQRADRAAQLARHGRGRGDLRQRHDHAAGHGGLPRHDRRAARPWRPTPATCSRPTTTSARSCIAQAQHPPSRSSRDAERGAGRDRPQAEVVGVRRRAGRATDSTLLRFTPTRDAAGGAVLHAHRDRPGRDRARAPSEQAA